MKETQRHIVHVRIPDFCTALEQLRAPELRNQPLVLAEPASGAVVQGVNLVARMEGVREGMVLARARRLCRRVRIVPPDLLHYRKRHRCIIRELGPFSPRVEGSLLGGYFVDLTGTDRLWGAASDTACRIEEHVRERMGLPGRVGLGASKLISQVAADSVPSGDLCRVFPGGEPSFLAPLPVMRLPGVGPVTAARLADFNVQRVGQLAALSVGHLFPLFGKAASRLVQLAFGIDPAPVVPFHETPTLCSVRNLIRREIDLRRLEGLLFRQIEEAGWILRRHNRCPMRVALEVRFADGVTARKRQRLPALEVPLDQSLFQAIRPAFVQIMERRVAVRRLALEFSHFVMPSRQLGLFPWEEAQMGRHKLLQEAVDRVRRRFGPDAVSWGRTLLTEEGEGPLDTSFRF